MSKFKFQILALLGGVYIVLIGLIAWPIRKTYGDTTSYQVDIATTPASGFLTTSNMAPGDEVSSILNVKNNGNLDFNYSVSSVLENGSPELFDKLQLTLSDSKGKLYEGTIGGLKDLPLGTIAVGGNSNLTFKALLPIDSDNAFQNKSISVAFNFNAIGHDEQIPINGCFEPPFSNNQFTLQQKSTVPIKFHLRSSTGELDTSVRNGVKLIVSGPGPNGGTVNYVFSVSDGTLKFDNKVDEPHYLCRFSTFDYPVLTDGTYKASVYDGTKLIFEKSFVVLDQGNRSNAP